MSALARLTGRRVARLAGWRTCDDSCPRPSCSPCSRSRPPRSPIRPARSTLAETVAPGAGSGFVPLTEGDGEPYVVRRGGRAKATRKRTAHAALARVLRAADRPADRRRDVARARRLRRCRRRRAEGVAPPAGGARHADLRRRSCATSTPTGAARSDGRGASAARLGFAHHHRRPRRQPAAQRDRAGSARSLDGGAVDPFSGQRGRRGNPCGGASPDDARAARTPTSPRAPTAACRTTTTGAARAPTSTPATGIRTRPRPAPARTRRSRATPGCWIARRRRSRPQGLDVPWYVSRGNHDGLIQGNAPASTDLFRSIAVGCLKVVPDAAGRPGAVRRARRERALRQLQRPGLHRLAARRRRSRAARSATGGSSTRPQFRGLMAEGSPRRARIRRDPARASCAARAGTASYYAVTPRKGLRFISLDTVAEGGGQYGNLDDPQYRWLKRELRKARRARPARRRLRAPHAGTMSNRATDEAAGRVRAGGRARLRRRPAPLDAARTAGCRRRQTVRALFAALPRT